MHTLWQDIRYAARMLRNQPGFTFVAIITLGLGIGANTAIFSVVNAVLLRPLAFKDPEKLVSIYERRENSGRANLPVSGHEFAAWQERSHSFSALTLIQGDGLTLTGRGEPAIVDTLRVSTDFFAVLGVPPVLGRGFAPGEDDKGGAKLVVLSQKLWTQRFGSDRNVINQTILLNDEGYTVIGVMPALELIPDVILPIDMRGEVLKVGKHSHQVIGRLKPAITLEQAQADLAVISNQIEQELEQDNKGHLVQAVPILATVGVFGVINYSVAQRTHELGIRIALGAQRSDVFRLVVGQGLVLAFIGVAIGVAGAFALTRLISGLLYGVSPTDSFTFVLVSVLVTVVAMLACYVPTRRATRVDPLVALKWE